MTAFKRYQSKVFWDHMASNDLRNEGPFSYQAGPSTKDFRVEDVRVEEKEDEECVLSSESSLEGTVMERKNATVHSCKSDNGGQRCVLSLTENVHNRDDNFREEEAETGNFEDKAAGSCDAAEQRSCSPISQDLRSQDSGFSDSERSDFLSTYPNETPRLRRRRKTRQKRKSNNLSKTNYFHLSRDEQPPTPAHTSTPKDCRALKRFQSTKMQPQQDDLFEYLHERTQLCESEEFVLPSSSNVSFENEECFGDFLYAAEPPEDGTLPRPAKLYSPSTTSTETGSQSVSQRSTAFVGTAATGQTSATRAWLGDLALITESECCTTLQSKSLPRRKIRRNAPETEIQNEHTLSTMATAAASRLLVSGEQFDKHYRQVVEEITLSQQRGDWRSDKRLIRSIEEHAFSILSELGAPPPRRIRQTSPLPTRELLRQLQDLKSNVDVTLDTRLDFYIEKVVRELEDVSWEKDNVIRGALAALTALGLAGARAGSSIARCAGVRVLLTLLVSSSSRSQTNDARAAVLRALASVCCSATAIECFVKDGGPEILTEFLAAELSPEKIRTEAAALVVQITAPWTNAAGLPYLEAYAETLIPSLSRLAEHTTCGQTLLLSVAALNQLSHSSKCITVMLEDNTVTKVLRSIKKTTGGNVWVMEQAAALIGQLARHPEARPYLAKARASVALVCFLRMRPPGLEDAYQKLEFTAAAALTRLCVDPEIARQVVTVGGADCLPSYDTDVFLDEDGEQTSVGLLKYTKSLRRACRKAAKQIDNAKGCDY